MFSSTVKMKRCIKTSETAFHSSWALGNNKGGRKPSVSEQLWSSSELSGSSDVITAHGDAYQPSAAVIMIIIIILIRGVHLVLLVDRRHGKQKDVSWGIQNKQKKNITKESPIISVYYRSGIITGQKKLF